MKEFTSTQLQQNTGDVTSVATYEPVIITSHGRPVFELRPVNFTHSASDVKLLFKAANALGIATNEPLELSSGQFLNQSRRVFRAVNSLIDSLNNTAAPEDK